MKKAYLLMFVLLIKISYAATPVVNAIDPIFEYKTKVLELVEKIKLVKDSAGCSDVISSYKGDINHYIEKIKKLSSQVRGSDKITENTITYVKVKDVAELNVKNNQIEILQSKLNKETIRANENEIKACLQQKKAIKRLWWMVGLVGVIGLYTALKFKAILQKFI